MPEPPATLFNSTHRQHLPPGTGTVGMVLFLLALAMLFISSLLGFLLIRYASRDAPAAGTLDLPWALWLSTLVMLASSVTMHWSFQSVRMERQGLFRRWLAITLGLAVLFLIVQTPSLFTLVQDHLPQMREYQQALDQARARGDMSGGAGVPMPISGLVFLLIFVHALHVIGGLLPLVVVTVKAQRGAYDHEHHRPVKHMAMYWHFLDAVWIVMFATLLLAA